MPAPGSNLQLLVREVKVQRGKERGKEEGREGCGSEAEKLILIDGLGQILRRDLQNRVPEAGET